MPALLNTVQGFEDMAPAPTKQSGFVATMNELLDVKDVQKNTICTWYLALFYVFGAVYLLQIIALFVALEWRSMWMLVPVLLVDAVAVANIYFYYAMCSKLPEGFTESIINAGQA